MALASIVIAGWFVQSTELVQVRATWAPMQFNTALCFLLLGAALFFVDRFHPVTGVGGALVLSFGALTLLAYFTNTESGLDRLFVDPFTTAHSSYPGRMAPNTAAGFCLSGAAILILGVPALASRFSPAAMSLGLVTTLIGAFGIVTYLVQLPSVPGWRAFTAIALTTAIAFIVVGIAISVRASEMHKAQKAPPWSWLPSSVGLVVLLVSFMLWQALGEGAIDRAQTETAQVLDRTRGIVIDRVNGQINLLQRFSQRISDSDRFPDAKQWSADAELLLDHFPYINGLGLTDGAFVYRYTSYRDIDRDYAGRGADIDARRREIFEAAIRLRKVRVTPAVRLIQGGNGFVVVSPIFRQEKFTGLMLAGIRFSELMQSPSGEYPQGYAFSVTENGDELYRFPEDSGNPFSDYVHSALIELPGTVWKVQAWPSREHVAKLRGHLPEMVLLFGVLTAILAGATLRMAQLSMARNRRLAEFTRELESEIGERRRVEDEVRKLNAELESRVEQRTRELESMNRELEAFSYSVSHDLRAPLASIAGFSKMLAESVADKLGEDGMHYVQRIGSNVTRMGQLIDDLLNLGRVNRAGLDIQEVNLSGLAKSIISNLAERDPSRRVETRVEDHLRAHADPNLIEIALENLLSNAWKFSAKSEHAVIEVGKETQDGREVFFVRDNGVGFDMNFAGKLFGVFQRLHSESEFPGNGVGLVTVKRVLARHRGEVWGKARIGEGAVFFFWLPN